MAGEDDPEKDADNPAFLFQSLPDFVASRLRISAVILLRIATARQVDRRYNRYSSVRKLSVTFRSSPLFWSQRDFTVQARI